jgi:pimeloyl-ACP methyl ester carboxylesterase
MMAVAAAAAPFESQRVIVTVQGQGPDVILVPGLTSNPRIYGGLVNAVPGYRYHLVQVRGFSGNAPGANAQGDVAAPVAEELARYIREAGLVKPAVIGHSMGGTIGMMLAARHPQAVGRLMIVDMVPFTGLFYGASNADEARAAFDKQAAQLAAGGPEAAGRMMTTMISAMVNSDAERAPVLNDARTSDPGTVQRAYREINVTDLRPELKAISAPVTVLYVKPNGVALTDAQIDATYRAQYANIPGATLTRIPAAAHFIMLDAPARFAEEVRAFLR